MVRPLSIAAKNCSSYSFEPEIAFWKMVGFDVNPRMPLDIDVWSEPSTNASLRRLSSQGLCACSVYSLEMFTD
jgi:hypothetical protein